MRGWRALWRDSPRTVCAAIGVALVLLIGGSALLSVLHLRERAIADWREQLSNLSLIVAENTSQSITSAYLVLDSLCDDARAASAGGASLAQAMGNARTHQLMQARIRGLPQIDVATIVGAGGEVINFTRSYPAPPISLADRDYFAYHRDHPGDQVFLSAPVQNRGNGRWTFYLSRRLHGSDGSFRGLVLIGISSDFFVDFFKRISLGGSAAFSLSRDDFTLLARWPVADKLLGKRNLVGSTYQVINSGKDHDVILNDGPRAAADMRSVTRLSAPRRVPNYPLLVNISVTEDLFLAGWEQGSERIWAIAGASVLALSGAFVLLWRLLGRSGTNAALAEAQRRRADQANAEKSRFLAMMSHEIRTPLAGMSGMADLLLSSKLDEEQRGYAAGVQAGAGALMRIINDLLDLSRVEAGKLTLEQLAFDPARLLRETVELHRVSALRKDLAVECSVDMGSVRAVVGDPLRLAQVMGNLISNAIKFTASGKITVSLQAGTDPAAPQRALLRFAVADTGGGIGAAALSRLFQPYSQADSAVAREHGGSGLGLAICKHLIELQGGTIGCTSTPGLGATFSFVLPCELAGAPATAPPPPAASGAPLPLRVLVAEDTEINRNLARALLKRMGCEVSEAHDGRAALAALETGSFDVVLMDCMMPEMDGYEAVTRLRALEAAEGRPRLPVIALTASALDGDRERCLKAGMDDYLAKPFNAAQLADMLRRWGKQA